MDPVSPDALAGPGFAGPQGVTSADKADVFPLPLQDMNCPERVSLKLQGKSLIFIKHFSAGSDEVWLSTSR